MVHILWLSTYQSYVAYYFDSSSCGHCLVDRARGTTKQVDTARNGDGRVSFFFRLKYSTDVSHIKYLGTYRTQS